MSIPLLSQTPPFRASPPSNNQINDESLHKDGLEIANTVISLLQSLDALTHYDVLSSYYGKMKMYHHLSEEDAAKATATCNLQRSHKGDVDRRLRAEDIPRIVFRRAGDMDDAQPAITYKSHLLLKLNRDSQAPDWGLLDYLRAHTYAFRLPRLMKIVLEYRNGHETSSRL